MLFLEIVGANGSLFLVVNAASEEGGNTNASLTANHASAVP